MPLHCLTIVLMHMYACIVRTYTYFTCKYLKIIYSRFRRVGPQPPARAEHVLQGSIVILSLPYLAALCSLWNKHGVPDFASLLVSIARCSILLHLTKSL